MRKVIIIGEIPEHFQNKIEELKSYGIEIVCLKDELEVGVVGHSVMELGLNSHFLHHVEMTKEEKKVVRMNNDSDSETEGSFESLYGKPSELIMKITPVERFDFVLPTTFQNKNRYKKREYKLSAGTKYKPNKKRK